MFNEELEALIRKSIIGFEAACKQYEELVSNLKTLEEEKDKLSIERDMLQKKEKLEDMFSEKVYLLKKKESEAEKVEAKIGEVEKKMNDVSAILGQVRNEVLNQAKELRFPIDHRAGIRKNRTIEFSYIDDLELSEKSLKILAELLDKEYPIKIEETTFVGKKVFVEATSAEDALRRIIDSVQAFRYLIDSLLHVYESIDDACKRVKESERYSAILTALHNSNGKLSIDELAQRTELSKSSTYQAVYDLAVRDIWYPHPVKKTNEGRYTLTTVGKILMKRYAERYPLPKKKMPLEAESEVVSE